MSHNGNPSSNRYHPAQSMIAFVIFMLSPLSLHL